MCVCVGGDDKQNKFGDERSAGRNVRWLLKLETLARGSPDLVQTASGWIESTATKSKYRRRRRRALYKNKGRNEEIVNLLLRHILNSNIGIFIELRRDPGIIY